MALTRVPASGVITGTSFTFNSVNVTATNAVSSTVTGALVVAGGIGAGGGAVFGGIVTATTFIGAFNGTVTGTASSATYATNASTATYAQYASSSTYATNASSATYATSAGNAATANKVNNAHTAGTGLSGSTFDGSAAVTWTVNTATLMQTASNLAGGSAGQFAYQSAASTTAFVGTGSMYVYRATVADSATSAGTLANNHSTGTGILGSTFNGSAAATWSLDTSTLMSSATYAINASTATYARYASSSTYGTYASSATYATYASSATYATYASSSTYGTYASTATYAQYASSSTYAIYSSSATYATSAGTAAQVTNSVTFNNSNTGDASGTAYNGSTARTISANTLGALSLASGGTVSGAVTFSGPITFSGTTTYVSSTNTYYTDNIIELHTPPSGPSGTWSTDDGKDIGLRFHYYTGGADTNAALVLANDTKWLEWYSSGAEGPNTFTGSSYGNFKTGGLWATSNAGIGTSSALGKLNIVDSSSGQNTLNISRANSSGAGDWAAQQISYSGSWSLNSGAMALTIVTDTAVSSTSSNTVGAYGIGFDGAGFFGVKGLYNSGYSASPMVFKVTPSISYHTTPLAVVYTSQQSGAALSVNGGVYVNGTVTATSFVGALSQSHSAGTGLTGSAYNGSTAQTWTLNTATLMNIAVNLTGGAAGSLVYQSAANATTNLAIGTSGYVLTSNGSAPTWSAASGITAGNATSATYATYAGSAAQANTIQATANSSYYPTFVDSNNATSAAEIHYTTSSFAINAATGNVGIGATTPTSKLHIAGPTNTTAGTAGYTVHVRDTTAAVGTWGISGVGMSSAPGLDWRIGKLWTGAASTFVIGDAASTTTNFITIDSSGNTGIGNATPGQKLEVAGGLKIGGSAATLGATMASGVTFSYEYPVTRAYFGDRSGWSFAFTTRAASSSVDVMTINDSGAISFNGSYGTSGQVLQSNGNSYPTWVNQSSIAAGSAPLTNTYVGYGSASNLLTGSSGLTYASSILNVSYQNSFNSTTPGTGTYGIHLNGQSTNDYATGITFSGGSASAGNANAGIYSQGSGSYGTRMYLATTDSYASGAKTRVMINETGSVFINSVTGADAGGVKLYVSNGSNGWPQTSGTTQTYGALRLRGGDNAVLDFGMNSVNTWIQATDKSGLNNNYAIMLNPNGGNVGIGTGTAAPWNRFNVSNGGAAGIEFAPAGGYSGIGAVDILAYNRSGSAYVPIVFITNSGNNAFTMSTSGYFGIGTTNPQKQLTFAANNDDAIRIIRNTVGSGDPAIGTGITWTWNSQSDNWAAIRAIFPGSGNTHLTFSTSNGSGQTGLAERMRISDVGAVTIGTSGTVYNSRKLSVSTGAWFQGNATFATDSGAGSSYCDSSATALYLGPGSTRSATVGLYHGGIGFDHLLNYNTVGNASYSNSPHAWIGMRLVSTVANEQSALVFATRNTTADTNSGSTVERMCIMPNGYIGMNSNLNPSYLIDTAPLTGTTTDTDRMRWAPYNGPSAGGSGYNYGSTTGGGTSLGTGIVWAPNYSGYSKRSAGILQIAEGNYFRSGLAFYTNNIQDSTTDWTEAMRIGSNGNVQIGGGSSPSLTNKFEVDGSNGQLFSVVDSFTGTIFSANDISGIPSIEVLDTGLVKFAQYNGSVAISTSTAVSGSALTVNGILSIVGTSGELRASSEITAYYSSDARLKENVSVISNPIEMLSQINGVYFDWTDEYIQRRGGEDGFFVRKHDIGVIAQEVEAILPEIVATREDGYKAVKYEKIVPLLIEAVKTQQQTIDALKAELQEIKDLIKGK